MTNTDDEDKKPYREGIIDEIESRVEDRINHTPLTILLKEQYSGIAPDQDTRWAVVNRIHRYKSQRLTVEDTRLDAIEYALRTARNEAAESNHDVEHGIGIERDLLVGTRSAFDLIDSGETRYRIVQVFANPEQEDEPARVQRDE